MDNRPSRGRGGHWKRGGGGGDTGSSGEQRGRGRGGHHRGRGKRDHRGRGQYHGPPADFRRVSDDDLLWFHLHVPYQANHSFQLNT